MQNYKLKTLSQIARIAAQARENGRTVVTTNGCFDILHIGHIRNLEFCKRRSMAHGGMLIVGLNSDVSVRKLKGESRPIVSQKERAEVIAALECVDYVFIFDGSPIDWIRKIKPDVQVKSVGVKNSPAFLPEKQAVEANGGRVVLAPHVSGKSTTDLIRKMKAL